MKRWNVFGVLGMILCVVALLAPGSVLADAESDCETARTAALQAQNEAIGKQWDAQSLADRYTSLIERRFVSASIETRWCDAGLGIGWWVRGHWRKWSGWLRWERSYYDGWWFGARLGPFFFWRGP